MIELRTFTPSEAAKISGVNVALQRDWRRRGILPATEGRVASFSPFEVAEMMALNALAERGGGPANFKGISAKLGAGIVQSALSYRSSYMGPVDDHISDDDKWLSVILSSSHLADLKNELWEWRSDDLQRRVLKKYGYSGYIKNRFIQWANGAFDFYASIEDAFHSIYSQDDGRADARLAGAVLILDLRTLGQRFAAMASPFATLDDGLPIKVEQDRQGQRRARIASRLLELGEG